MRKRWLLAWLGAWAALAGGAAGTACGGARLPSRPAGEAALTVRGQVKGGPFHLRRVDLEALPREAIQALPPGAAAALRLEGLPLRLLLEDLITPIQGADTLVAVTADGLAVPLTFGLIQQYGPILADRAGGAPSPLRLAWPNLDQPGLEADPRAARWWASPVVALEVVSWVRTWGRVLQPPPGAGDAARLGAGQYALRCAPCHRLQGVGGGKGPALDGAAARLGQAGFVAAVRAHPGWPAGLGAELLPVEEVAAQAGAFLEAVDQAGGPWK